jgi:hypothetical protein
MYGKLFASMYEGTLYGQWQAIVTLQQLVILSDEDGVVDMMPTAISARTSVPLEIIKIGIEQLSEPDPYSRSTDEDGRRIVLLDESRPWGWRIVNYKYYRNLGSKADKKIKDKIRIAEKRNKSNSVASCRNLSRGVVKVAHTKEEENTKEKTYSASGDAALPQNPKSPEEKPPEKSYTTKKGKKLAGKRLEAFEQFWDAFAHKVGRAEAAEEWLKVPHADNGTLEKILAAAKREAEKRPSLIERGLTPKMAQGWLSGRRWEDEPVDFKAEQERKDYYADKKLEDYL